MYGTEILEKFVLNCKASREAEIMELLNDNSNDFTVYNTGNQSHLKLGNETLCGLYKKEHIKVVDWDNLKYEHSKTLTNKKGEELTVTYAKVRLHGSHKNNPTGYNTTVMVFNTPAIEFETDSSAVYSSGEEVSKFKSDHNVFYLSDADRKRLGTYPIFIYKNGDKTKNGRFAMRYAQHTETEEIDMSEYSIYASGKDGTQTVDFVTTKEEAESKIAELKSQLDNGSYVNETDLDSVENFYFDTLG